MRPTEDRDVDAPVLRLDDSAVVESIEDIGSHVMFDFDANGRSVGIKGLDASERLAADADLKDPPRPRFPPAQDG